MSSSSSPVVLPSPFVLKVPGGKYLRRMGQDVQERDERKGAEYGFWEPFYKDSNQIAIRGVSGHYFWRYNRNWIKVDGYLDESNQDIWFRPVQLSPTQLGLYCISNGFYLYPLTVDSRSDTLNAALGRLHEKYRTVYTVEPAVLHRKIENVSYQFDKKEETQEKPIAAGELQVFHHGSKVTLTVNRTVSFAVAKERSWNTSSTFVESVEMSAEVPFFEVNVGFSRSSAKTKVSATGETNSEAVKDETSVSITAQPHHKTTAHFILAKGRISVPFTYDETVQHFDGTSEKKEKADGVYHSKEAGVDARWKISVEKIEEGIIEEVVEAAEEVAEAGVKAATTATTTTVKTAVDVAKTATSAPGSVLGGIAKGVGGVFGGQ